MSAKKITRIEHVAFPRQSERVFAIGEADNNVEVWSFTSGKKLAEIDTVLDFGGLRLGISDAFNAVIAGSWSKGLAAYDFQGRCIWARKLRHVQFVADLSINEQLQVGIGIDKGFFKILDQHGEEIGKIPSASRCFGSMYVDLLLLTSRKEVALSSLASPPIWRRKVNTFGVLCAAFSPTCVAYSEAAGLLYCIGLHGEEAWTFRPPSGWHVLDIQWNDDRQLWAVVLGEFEAGTRRSFIHLDARGTMKSTFELADTSDYKISPSGRYAVSSDRRVISTADTSEMFKLE